MVKFLYGSFRPIFLSVGGKLQFVSQTLEYFCLLAACPLRLQAPRSYLHDAIWTPSLSSVRILCVWCVRFEVLTSVSVKIAVLRFVTPCSLINSFLGKRTTLPNYAITFQYVFFFIYLIVAFIFRGGGRRDWKSLCTIFLSFFFLQLFCVLRTRVQAQNT
jgi:hypothetical protein